VSSERGDEEYSGDHMVLKKDKEKYVSVTPCVAKEVIGEFYFVFFVFFVFHVDREGSSVIVG
jgi:hypothetical protein